jgi:hypothetical protein
MRATVTAAPARSALAHPSRHAKDGDARQIRVVFIWSAITSSSAHWEQAFSVDGEETWETNWIMDIDPDRLRSLYCPSTEREVCVFNAWKEICTDEPLPFVVQFARCRE